MKLLSFLLAVSTLGAVAPPSITELRPRGAQKGRPFKLTVVGRDLGDSARITSPLPATFTQLAADPSETMGMNDRYATFLVEPTGDVAPGVYPVRVETAQGISNILLFTVGTFPELTEEESQPGSLPNRNDSIETAQGLPSTAVTLNGTLRGPERDVYRVQGKAGERRVFEVEARRCGSAIDPLIQVMDAQGKVLARSEDAPLLRLDARAEVTFPKDGFYYVEVHDARFSTQAQNFYRLKTGPYAYPTEIFPLGGRRGQVVDVSLGGVTAKADLTKTRPNQTQASVNLADSPALPLPFAIGDLPEVLETAPGPLATPVTVNGQLAKDGEIDKLRFAVEPGQDLMFELEARELGTSRLTGVITVWDPAGKKLASAGDGPLPVDVFQVQGITRTAGDPFVLVKIPEGVREVTVSVEDLALRGGAGYGYRLHTRRQAADFQLITNTPYVNIPAGGSAAVSVGVDRRGYSGPIQLRAANPPKGLVVEGGYIPEELLDGNNIRVSSRRGVLILTAEEGASIAASELTIVGEGLMAPMLGVSRQARGVGMVTAVAGATAQGVVDRQRGLTSAWLGYELPAAMTSAASTGLSVELVSRTRRESGDELVFRWKFTPRTPAMKMPEDVSPDMVSANDLRIIDMKVDPNDPRSGTFLITTTRNTNPSWYDLYVTARIPQGMGVPPEEIVSRPIRVQVEEVKSNGSATATSAQ